MNRLGSCLSILMVVLCCAISPVMAAPLMVGDYVYLDVYRVPEMSANLRIDQNGNVNLPYVGDVQIAGATVDEAAALVANALKSILHNPRVGVARMGEQVMMQDPGGRTVEMVMELIPLRNANARTMSEQLSRMSTLGGAISFDTDTNSLIVTDTPSAIRNIQSVVGRLDQMQSQLTQVRIDTKIAEVRVGALKEMGVRWFIQGSNASAGFLTPGRTNTALNAFRAGQGPLANEQLGSQSGSGGGGGGSGRRFISEPLDRRLNIPAMVALPGQTFLGLASGSIDLGAMLDMLVSDDKAKLLANPVLLTLNHRAAHIQMTDQFPYTEFGTDRAGASSFSTRFMDLGIVLDVTPHVYHDEMGAYVKLELKPEVSFPVGSSNGIPIRSVRSSDTVASVRDGQTLVVGGIFTQDEADTVSKVPGLGNLPIIGALFRHKEKSKTHSELMIFVTPTIFERPEDITWDAMIDISTELRKASLIPVDDIRAGSQKNRKNRKNRKD